eukprot:snap_masked-scaffold_2-processed-gene-6.23-mRNA-1 protein AED:1.00 eAED:1.00 QI:0/0/0/0/1/1/2/0/68
MTVKSGDINNRLSTNGFWIILQCIFDNSRLFKGLVIILSPWEGMMRVNMGENKELWLTRIHSSYREKK